MLVFDAQRAREQRADWYTARVVAMLAAVNSKHGRYEPIKYMADRAELMRRRAAARAAAGPFEGSILQRFRALGVPIVDKRKNKAV